MWYIVMVWFCFCFLCWTFRRNRQLRMVTYQTRELLPWSRHQMLPSLVLIHQPQSSQSLRSRDCLLWLMPVLSFFSSAFSVQDCTKSVGLILMTLMYSAELWPLTAMMAKKHIRRLLERQANKWGRTGQQTIDSILTERRLCWPGHVLRMDHQRPPQQALYWVVPGYKRGPGGPRTNWRGVIKKDLEKMKLTWVEVQSAALNRQEWHRSVAQCVHLDAGWIEVKVKPLVLLNCFC